jgi:predicted Zn-dependent protease
MWRGFARPRTRALSPLLAILLLLPAQAGAAQPPDVAAKSEAGKNAMAAGRYDEAAVIYAQLARSLPDDPGILMNLGMAQTMANRPREAIAPLERAVKLDPSLHPAWLFLGTAYLDARDAARAVQPLVRAVETEPRSIKAHQMLANAYLALERDEEAGKVLDTLTRLAPQDPAAWYALGQNHEARALRAFEQLRTSAPDSPYESLLVADVLASQEEYAQALEVCQAVLQRAPTLRPAVEAIVEIYERAGNPDGASAARRRLEALPPRDCKREKAACAFHTGRHREVLSEAGRKDAESLYWRARAHNELALEAFSELERLPPSAESHAFKAEWYRNQGRHLDSVAELQKAAKLAPGDRHIQRQLATSLYLSRDYDAAEPLLAALLKDEPSSADLSFMYGDTLLQAQQLDQAIPPLEAAVKRDPSMIEARVSLARAYLQGGRSAEAIPHLEAALPTDEDGSLHYQLARAYQATGQIERAKQMLAKYQEIEAKKRK